jgi:hydrogenase maturation protease
MTSILVAGIGNIFLGDYGFGPEVVRRIGPGRRTGRHRGRPRRSWAEVRLVDYGIRGVHLAYDLLHHPGPVIIVDTVPGPGDPGSVVVLEVGTDDLGSGGLDARSTNPVAVLAILKMLGGTLPPTYVVGCVPAKVDEGIGLSEVVSASVDDAVDRIYELVARLAVADRQVRPAE